jgi:hypothetical protein
MKTYYLDFVRDDTSPSRRYKREVGIDLLYSDVQKIRAETFEKSEIDEIVQWGFDDPTKERNLVDTDLYSELRAWFDKHNHAYWVWKPYIILDLLKSINDGDMVIYWDCSPLFPKFSNSFLPFLEHINEYEVVAGLEQYGLLHRRWTKKDCFELMDCTGKKYWRGRRQIQASWSVWKKSNKTIKVVEDWLRWCKNKNVAMCDLDNITNCKIGTSPNEASKGLVEGVHRHARDQSILTNVAIKHNCAVIQSRGSAMKLNSWFGKNLDNIAKNYNKCIFKTL